MIPAAAMYQQTVYPPGLPPPMYFQMVYMPDGKAYYVPVMTPSGYLTPGIPAPMRMVYNPGSPPMDIAATHHLLAGEHVYDHVPDTTPVGSTSANGDSALSTVGHSSLSPVRERRNKKRRPADYYQKLEERLSTSEMAPFRARCSTPPISDKHSNDTVNAEERTVPGDGSVIGSAEESDGGGASSTESNSNRADHKTTDVTMEFERCAIQVPDGDISDKKSPSLSPGASKEMSAQSAAPRDESKNDHSVDWASLICSDDNLESVHDSSSCNTSQNSNNNNEVLSKPTKDELPEVESSVPLSNLSKSKPFTWADRLKGSPSAVTSSNGLTGPRVAVKSVEDGMRKQEIISPYNDKPSLSNLHWPQPRRK